MSLICGYIHIYSIRLLHFYRILHCFYIFVQWSCSNTCVVVLVVRLNKKTVQMGKKITKQVCNSKHHTTKDKCTQYNKRNRKKRGKYKRDNVSNIFHSNILHRMQPLFQPHLVTRDVPNSGFRLFSRIRIVL